jgi:hypothetical protein
MSDLILTDSPTVTANEYILARETAATLHECYPGYLWGVNVERSIVNVRNLNLSGMWGFTLHVPAIYSASEWKKQVMRAGGEILERYRMRRGQRDEQRLLEAQRDYRGALLFDR